MDGDEYLRMPMADFNQLPPIERDALELIYFLRPWEVVDKTRTEMAVQQVRARHGDTYDSLTITYRLAADMPDLEPVARETWAGSMFALLTNNPLPGSQSEGDPFGSDIDLTDGLNF